MRISDLSRLSGVPVTTIKYYLREGLLPAGMPTAYNQAIYTDDHLRYLRLIRALVSVRGLSVSATSDILRAVSEQEGNLHRVLGLVLGALQTDDRRQHDGQEVPETYREQAEGLIDSLEWKLHPHSELRTELARSFQRMAEVGLPFDSSSLVPYGRLAKETAVQDLEQLDGVRDDPFDIAERAILVTVMMEPVLLLLRRMAQENESATRYSGPGSPPGEQSEGA
ncbi:MerR family transcriptional regulator [Streptomyces sp. PT12]|uniref:MerR family transcriptional regulator n=1 Tax=Streptomyces sp. PT12 TaxID=1510197 RepID=UPI000DE2B4F5|nr:MerR family transcriptional regulator [Streptomyces sp. PT12]RBM20679.1 transcriptional regulator [Streptomyces sp. PT12]